eukprot:CAMPEP_0197863044 /NCGR_PEP_ID=MMETSP1438-20131217/40210_1 /TAXON_ID=1461541 /ORGANISM="Pterosperma sp., Strain CCMP1384" /LENGTH=68 /DNA_ID=CAMNT_0043480787 /DNA_START=9 /DNA_END=218 /DNA_ORIENTATION=-
MVCNVAPSPAFASETLASLQFAQKVSAVELRLPRRHVEDAEEKRREAAIKQKEAAKKQKDTAKKTSKK